MDYQVLKVIRSQNGITFREIICCVVALGVGFFSHYFIPIEIDEDVGRFQDIATEEKKKLISINQRHSRLNAAIEEKLRVLAIKQRHLPTKAKVERIDIQAKIIAELKNKVHQKDRELSDLRDYIQVQANNQAAQLKTLNKYNKELQKSASNSKVFRDATIGLSITSTVLLAALGGVIYLRL